MLNRKGNSEKNITRFIDDYDVNDKTLSSFLPDFLVKKYGKEEGNPDLNKQSVFLDDESDEEGLEIKIDNYMINDKQMSNNINMDNNQQQRAPPVKKKSQSQKDVLTFNELSDETVDFSKFQNYNPKLNYQHKQIYPTMQQHHIQPNFNNDNSYKNYHNIINNNNNPNFYYSHPYNQQPFNKNNYHPQLNPVSNINYNNNNFSPPNIFLPNNYNNANISLNTYNNNNFNNNFYQYPNLNPNHYNGFVDMNNITNNMTAMAINNIDNPNNQYKYTNSKSFNHEAILGLENNDSLNISTNSSLDGGNSYFSIRAPPKKTFSDSNLKLIKHKSENPSKSLFKEKIDSMNEEINLAEILANHSFDLPEFIKTQRGSRIMQKELNCISPENLVSLLHRLCPSLTGIMIDTYGNYFSQKLIQCCSPQQRLLILKSIVQDFVMISCHNSGTHSIQCLTEIINLKEEEEIIKISIKNEILTLSYDINATHVMQKIIAIVEEKDREYINTVLLDNLLKLVFDANGICVIKRLINGNEDITIRNKILFLVQKNCLEIIQNPFGNYIIQHILEEWGPEVCSDVTKIIHQNLVSLSMQKFSSNVVEKCMDLISETSKKFWIKEIFNFSKISSILKNKYGNFVLQKAIMIMSPEEKKEIKEYLIKKIGLISNKEKARLKGLIDILN